MLDDKIITRLDISPVLEKCELFSEMQVWLLEPPIKPEKWLSNFTAQEMPFAEILLSNFFFFNEKMCNSMLKAAFENVFLHVEGMSNEEKKRKWKAIKEEAIFTTVDDHLDPTASGYIFCRKARQILRISPRRFFTKEEAIKKLKTGEASTVVFLDDFIGTGDQFNEAWKFEIQIDKETVSFKSIYGERDDIDVYYLPLVGTEFGIKKIKEKTPSIIIAPANILEDRYSVFHDESLVWPEHLKQEASAFIKDASDRAGINQWKGHGNLGLTIAFAHGIPDASLPIFWWDQNDWKPLMERR